ncbi:MAG TPA: hypothetical protein VFH70_09455, partial [Acidimicrobiales bacterium]|nr:hypothetical protein [Acidimicrobiales bacterium]
SRLAAAFPPGESLEVGLRRSLRSYFDMVDQRGTLLAALFQYRFSPARKEKMDRMWASVAGLFAERFAVDPGVPPRTAEAAAHMLLSAVVGAQQVWLGGRVSRAEVEELLVRMVADGLRGVVAERATGQGDTPRRPGNSPLPAIRTEV